MNSKSEKTRSIVSIVIVTYNSRDHIARCLASVFKSQPPHARDVAGARLSATDAYNIIVVDNASSDGTADFVQREFPGVRLIRSAENRGFAAGCNHGILAAGGDSEFYLLLNPDAVLATNALRRALAYMRANHDAGILGGRLTDPAGCIQPSARRMPDLTKKFGELSGVANRLSFDRMFATIDHHRQSAGLSGATGWVVGAFFLMRQTLLRQTGLLDENYFLYFEEIDLCGLARAKGFEVHYAHDIRITHVGGASAKTTQDHVSAAGSQLTRFRAESELYYYRKTHGLAAMLGAAALEMSLSALIYCKHTLRKARNARRDQARQNLRTMWAALKQASFRAPQPRTPALPELMSGVRPKTTRRASALRTAS